MRTLIRNGTLVSAGDQSVGDLLIEDGRIAAIGLDLERRLGPADQSFEATGRLVMPGGVDVHVHLDLPMGATRSSDDFETGTRAAAFGGTTTIVDFAAQPKQGTLRAGLDEQHRLAEGKACIDYAFHMVVRSVTPEILDEMDRLVRDEGIPSFKLFTAYPGNYMLDDGALLRALQRTAENGGLVMVHAENGPAIDALVQQALARGETAPKYHALTRPARLEAEATARCLALAETAGAPLYVVHLSSSSALEELRRARERGVAGFAETCPQYLVLDQRELERPGFEGAQFVFSPPLRPAGNGEALWRGLAAGDLAVVATDHCPFTLEQKALGRERFTLIPNGLPGIETRLPLVWDRGVGAGRFDACRFVELCATAPAKLFGLYPTKGTLSPGSDADVVVWDPQREVDLGHRALHMRTDYSPYEGWRTRGGPQWVFARGKLVVDGDRWLGRAGDGRFLKRKPFAGGAATP